MRPGPTTTLSPLLFRHRQFAADDRRHSLHISLSSPLNSIEIIQLISARFTHQHSDETPMVWEMLLYLYIFYSPDWHYKSTMPTVIFLYGAAFGLAHHFTGFDIIFKVHYMVLCLLCIPRIYKYYIHINDIYAKRPAKLYLMTLLLGSLCWFADREFCKELSSWYLNPQGHALWHIFMALNSHFANTFLIFCRAQQLEWE